MGQSVSNSLGVGEPPSLSSKTACKIAIRGAKGKKDFEDKVIQTFNKWDTDENGSISVRELSAVFKKLNPKFEDAQIQLLLKEADVDGNGEIDYREFVAWIFCAPNMRKMFDACLPIVEYLRGAAKHVAKKPSNRKMIDSLKMADNDIKTKIVPLISKAFQWHDKDETGVIGQDESIVFFSNYVQLLLAYLQPILELNVYLWLRVKKYDDFFNRLVEKYTDIETYKERFAEYKRNADRHNLAAFRVIDTNTDGLLCVDEVVAALTPGTEKNMELMSAFNLSLDLAGMQKEMDMHNDWMNQCARLGVFERPRTIA